MGCEVCAWTERPVDSKALSSQDNNHRLLSSVEHTMSRTLHNSSCWAQNAKAAFLSKRLASCRNHLFELRCEFDVGASLGPNTLSKIMRSSLFSPLGLLAGSFRTYWPFRANHQTYQQRYLQDLLIFLVFSRKKLIIEFFSGETGRCPTQFLKKTCMDNSLKIEKNVKIRKNMKNAEWDPWTGFRKIKICSFNYKTVLTSCQQQSF